MWVAQDSTMMTGKDYSIQKIYLRKNGLNTMLSNDFRNVIEFRHNSWFDEEVYDIMKKHNVSFCMISAPGNLKEDAVKSNELVYIRFHGKKQWYKYYYTEEELQNWADKLKNLKAQQIYAYFNNDYDANAPENASQLAGLLK